MFKNLLIIATITSFCTSTVTKTQVLKKSDYTKLIAFTAGAGVVACAASYKFPRITLGAYAGAFAAGNAAGYVIFRKQNKAFSEQIEKLKESNATEAEIAELEEKKQENEGFAITTLSGAIINTCACLGLIANALMH